MLEAQRNGQKNRNYWKEQSDSDMPFIGFQDMFLNKIDHSNRLLFLNPAYLFEYIA